MIKLNLWFPFSSKLYFFYASPVTVLPAPHPNVWLSFFIHPLKHPSHLTCHLEMSLPYHIHRYVLLTIALTQATIVSHINHRHTLLADIFMFLSSTLIFFLKMCHEMLCHVHKTESESHGSPGRSFLIALPPSVLFSPGACPCWGVENLDWSI